MIEKCCICGKSVETKYKIRFVDLLGSESHEYIQHIGFCSECGYIFTQNPFTPQQLEKRYKQMSKFEYDAEKYEYVIKDVYKSQCIRQKNFIDESVGKGSYDSILEIGAASGYNLWIYQQAGIKDVMGIEPSELNCKLAKKKYNIDMFTGMFDEFACHNSKKYDLIFLSMILEHIVNPLAFIESCGKICSKYIFIEVPCLEYKTEEEPFGMFCEEQVSLFTLESLDNLMNKAGFVCLKKEVYFDEQSNLPAGYPSLCTIWERREVSAKRLIPMISSEQYFDFYIRQNSDLLLRKNEIIKKIPDDISIALWGCGHHISMLLGNTDLPQKKNSGNI